MNDINETETSTNSRTLTLRSGSRSPSGKPTVLFVALSALGVTTMPGLTEPLLGSLVSTVVSTARADEGPAPKGKGDGEETILPGYEEEILALLWELGVEVPEKAHDYISLLELGTELGGATVLREGDVVLLLTDEGQTLPAPDGFYVFPDGLVALIEGESTIVGNWGDAACSCGGGPWSMCQTSPGVWVDC